MSLRGRTVLIPRGGDRGAAWAREVEGRGGSAVVAPLVEIVPPHDDAALRRALAELAGGSYAWVAFTSAHAVTALTSRGAQLGGARVAVVGDATAAAVREARWPVDLVPAEHSAAGMVDAWPAHRGGDGDRERVLLPLSALAGDTLERGLAARGFAPERVEAYDVAALEPDQAARDAVSSGAVDAVVVTSGSVARRVVQVFAPVPAALRIVCIGEPSARAASAAGLRVDAVATTSTGPGTIAALEDFFARSTTDDTTEIRENAT